MKNDDKMEAKLEENPEKGGTNGVLGVIFDEKSIKNASKNQYKHRHRTN